LPQGEPARTRGDHQPGWSGHVHPASQRNSRYRAMPMRARMPSPPSSDSPESGLSGSEDDLNRLIQLTSIGSATRCQPFAQAHHKDGTHHFGSNLDRLADFTDLIHHKDVGDQHAARNPAQQRGTKGDHQREAVDQLQNQSAAPDDDGHTHDQTEDHIIEDRKSTRLNSSHVKISYAVSCLKKQT